MKNKTRLLAFLLVLTLMLCLIPATALADPTVDEDAEEAETLEGGVTEETEAADEADAPEDAEAPEEDAEEPEEVEEAAPITNEEDESFFAAAEDTVYNNGGTVYNNGGTVYNNGGTVYHNDGTVYNNGGIVYSNGGTVYNNGGTVYNNGAMVYSFTGNVEESRIYGYYKLSTAQDYSALAELEGLSPDGYLSADDRCTITPHEGFVILSAEADAGTLTAQEDGSYILEQVNADVTLTLRFQAEAPAFDLEPGTYAEEKSLTITAPEGAAIYYTTDGSEPRVDNSSLYEEPIAIGEGMTVKAVAVAEGAVESEICSADYAFVTLTAPQFDPVEEGYSRPAAQAITVENEGSTAARIESVSLEGKQPEAFTLSNTGGATVKAGKTNDSTWTLRPAKGLEKGSYKASVVFTLDSGETMELKISFQVK